MIRTHRRPRWRWPFTHSYDDAQQDLKDTERELARVRRQWPVVHELVAAIGKHTDRNHFGESIANLYRGEQT